MASVKLYIRFMAAGLLLGAIAGFYIQWHLLQIQSEASPLASPPTMTDFGQAVTNAFIFGIFGTMLGAFAAFLARFLLSYAIYDSKSLQHEELPMNKMLQTLVGRLNNPDEDETALDCLMPLIVPASYFAENRFPAPSVILPCGDFALTAVILGKGQTMVYVTKERAEAWAAAGISWQDRAMQNLQRDNGGDPFTHSKYSDDKRLLFAMMMNPDGLGTSRVYCSDALRRVFPEGYWVAIPERSVGCAISKAVTKAEKQEAVEMVAECFRVGTVPNSPKLFEPEELGA